MLTGRPLYDNKADAEFFVPPPEWDALMRAIDHDLNTLVVGRRGVGKTSLLHQVQRVLRENGERVVFVDASAVREPVEFSSRIRDALLGQRAPLVASAQMLGAAVRADPAPVAGASRLLSDDLRAIGEAEPTRIIVDGSDSADAAYAIFGRMRDTLWQFPHSWIVAADEEDRTTLLKPPADAFFDAVLELGPWSTNELVGLLSRRLSNGARANAVIRDAAAAGTGTPRDAIRAVSDALLHDRNPSEAVSERAKLLESASELGRPYAMLMAELLDHGQASPSDERLQAALGLSRARITHLLRQLREEGLVVADSERSDGPGRPRTMYRPRLPRNVR